MGTTDAANNELIRRLQEEVLQAGNLEVVDELFAEDFVGHSAGKPEEYKASVALVQAASSDMDATTEDLIVGDDMVVQRVRSTGIRDGEFMALNPTGNTIEITVIDIYRVKDREFVEGWEQTDMLGLMQQLGVMEPPGAKPILLADTRYERSTPGVVGRRGLDLK